MSGQVLSLHELSHSGWTPGILFGLFTEGLVVVNREINVFPQLIKVINIPEVL